MQYDQGLFKIGAALTMETQGECNMKQANNAAQLAIPVPNAITLIIIIMIIIMIIIFIFILK